MKLKERWKVIPGWETYEVSTKGRIRRCVPSKNNHKQLKILKAATLSCRMKQVILYKDGKPTGFKVHRLVALAFLPPPKKEQTQINHKDGDRANNKPSNLEWCTPKENIQHSIKTGLRNNQARGERIHGSKLTEVVVKEILLDISKGIREMEAIKKYKITGGTFQDLKWGRTWKHIKRP